MIEVFYPLLLELTDRPVIQAYRNGKEPPKPFVSYALRFERMPEHTLESEIDESGRQTVLTHIDATLELQCFCKAESGGEGSLSMLRRLAMRLQTQTQRDKWERAGVSLIEIGKFTHLPFVAESKKYVDRTILDLSVRYTATAEDIIQIIKTVKIDHRLDNLKGDQTVGD